MLKVSFNSRILQMRKLTQRIEVMENRVCLSRDLDLGFGSEAMRQGAWARDLEFDEHQFPYLRSGETHTLPKGYYETEAWPAWLSD